MNTTDYVTEFLRNSKDQTEKDGNIIAILHKTASELKNECKRLTDLVNQKNDELNKKANESNSEDTSEQYTADKGINEEQFRSVLRKMAEEDMVYSDNIDQHVEAAKQSSDHVLKMMEMMTDHVKDVRSKTASEDKELKSVGQPRESVSKEDKLSKAGFEGEVDKQVSSQIADLDRQLGTML